MEEDAAEISLSRAGRLLAEFRAERDQRREAEAKTAGFLSWDEYDKHLIEESRKLDEERERKLDEKCALLGKTREELYAEDPQRFILDDGGLPWCDCDGKFLSINPKEANLTVLQTIPYPSSVPNLSSSISLWSNRIGCDMSIIKREFGLKTLK